MTTTELITPPRTPSADPTWRETVDETLPLIAAVPEYGPPVVVLAAPWLLLSLMLAGPFAVLVTLVVLLVVAAAVLGLIGAVLAAPYLLVRHLRGSRAGHGSMRAIPTPHFVVEGSRWAAP